MAYNKFTSTNLAQGTFNVGVLVSDTTWVLGTGQGGLFPSAFPFMLKAEQLNGSNQVIKREIVKCTNRVGDTLTVVRTAEACPSAYNSVTQTSTAFAFNAGDTISQIISAGSFKDVQDEVDTKLALAGGQMTGVLKEAKGSDIASASTVDLATATGNYVTITGTTTITSLGIVTAGARFTLDFTGILTLTYNATSLKLPTQANIVTQVGDKAVFRSEGGGNWDCESYTRADGSALISTPVQVTQTSYIAGENLTIGVPVYISNGTGGRTAGRVYRADALDVTFTDSINFIGFAGENGTTGNALKINIAGIDNNQTGLTIGVDYYLSDTVGVISNIPGTNFIFVGRAVSSTAILINNFIGQKTFVSSANFHENASIERSNGGVVTPVKFKDIKVLYQGTINVSFDLKNITAGQTANGQIYKNGIAVGTLRSTTLTTYTTYTETIQVSSGDNIQLYLWCPGGVAYCQNFKIGYDIVINTLNTLVLN